MTTRTTIAAGLFLLITITSQAYTLLDSNLEPKWGPGNVPFYINLGAYDAQAHLALADWTHYTGKTHLSGIDVGSGSTWANGRNDIAWSTNYGFSLGLGNNVLAVTLPGYSWPTGAMTETDIVFNAAFSWGSFTGSHWWQYDVNRVLLHELGHSIGLGHSPGANIMNAYYNGNVWELSADDIAGARHLYGNTTTGTVPESGSTVVLLVLALGGLVWMKRCQ